MKTITKAYRFKLNPRPSQESNLFAIIRATNDLWNLLVEQQRYIWDRLRQWPKEDHPRILSEILTEWRGGPEAIEMFMAEKRERIEKKVRGGVLSREAADTKIAKLAFNPYVEMWNTIALQVTELRHEFDSIEAAPAISLRAVVQNMERQTAGLYKGIRGRSRFHSIDRGGGFKFFGEVELLEREDGKVSRIKLPKIGPVRIHFADRRYPPSGLVPIKSGAVTWDGINWWCSITVEELVATPTLNPLTVYVHLGLKRAAFLLILHDDGKREYWTFDMPEKLHIGDRFITYSEADKVMRRLQRSLDRRQKGSKRREFRRKSIQLFHRQMAEERTKHLHQLSNKILALKPQRIVVQEWEVQQMMQQRKFSKLIARAGWATLFHQMRYKAEWQNTVFVSLPAKVKVSKTCSECGAVNENFPLGRTVYVCDICGMRKDRERNARDNMCNAAAAL